MRCGIPSWRLKHPLCPLVPAGLRCVDSAGDTGAGSWAWVAACAPGPGFAGTPHACMLPPQPSTRFCRPKACTHTAICTRTPPVPLSHPTPTPPCRPHPPVQPAWRKADGTWVPAKANFTSLATPNEVGSGHTALTTLLHEGGHAAHFANIDQHSPLFSQVGGRAPARTPPVRAEGPRKAAARHSPPSLLGSPYGSSALNPPSLLGSPCGQHVPAPLPVQKLSCTPHSAPCAAAPLHGLPTSPLSPPSCAGACAHQRGLCGEPEHVPGQPGRRCGLAGALRPQPGGRGGCPTGLDGMRSQLLPGGLDNLCTLQTHRDGFGTAPSTLGPLGYETPPTPAPLPRPPTAPPLLRVCRSSPGPSLRP